MELPLSFSLSLSHKRFLSLFPFPTNEWIHFPLQTLMNILKILGFEVISKPAQSMDLVDCSGSVLLSWDENLATISLSMTIGVRSPLPLSLAKVGTLGNFSIHTVASPVRFIKDFTFISSMENMQPKLQEDLLRTKCITTNGDAAAFLFAKADAGDSRLCFIRQRHPVES